MEEWRARLGNIGARLGGLLKQIGNWRSIGELGEQIGNNGGDWQTINWSKIRRITKAKTGEHFQLLFIL